MLFNCFHRKSPTLLRLDVVSPMLVSFTQVFRHVCVIVGVLLMLSFLPGFFGVRLGSVTERMGWVVGGMILVTVGNLMGMVAQLMLDLGIACIFDGEQAEVRFETRSKNVLQALSQPIPFSQVRMLRLKHISPDASNRGKRLLLELVTDNHTFYPVSMFRSMPKVSAIVKEIQHLLHVPLIEEPVREYTFRSYKEAFTRQFETTETSTLTTPKS